MPDLSNVLVAMECQDGTILGENATGKVEENKVRGKITVTSTSWKMKPTPNVGREYYVKEFGTGRSWKCDCNAFSDNIATFSIIKMNPC